MWELTNDFMIWFTRPMTRLYDFVKNISNREKPQTFASVVGIIGGIIVFFVMLSGGNIILAVILASILSRVLYAAITLGWKLIEMAVDMVTYLPRKLNYISSKVHSGREENGNRGAHCGRCNSTSHKNKKKERYNINYFIKKEQKKDHIGVVI